MSNSYVGAAAANEEVSPFFRFYFIYLLMLLWVFVATCRLSLVVATLVAAHRLLIAWLLLLQSTGCRVRGLQ